MRADYHLHPNLPPWRPEKRLRALWNAIDRNRLEAVVCAEHTFKDAPDAYRKLTEAKPKNMKCHVFPGAELVTNDEPNGVDVIAFGEEDWYDDHPKLLEPFSMTLPEMIAYLEASNLSWFIPHPTIVSTPLLYLYPRVEEMQDFLATVPAFEAKNGTYVLIEHLCHHPLIRIFMKSFRKRLRHSAEPPLDLYFNDHAFLAVGSDAHHPHDIGYSVEIPARVTGRGSAFHALTHNTNLQTVYLPGFSYPLARFLSMAATALWEWRMRKAGMRDAKGTEEEVPLVPAEVRVFGEDGEETM